MTQTIILLQSLTFGNFKGLEDYTLDLSGRNADIFGRNATCKSTLYNGFLWLLFGKDSFNRSDYQIKPQDEDGNELHHIESIVEGVLSVDGKELKLKRMLSEKWVKVRGVLEKEYKGNETSYWVNDVPVKAGEYAIEIGTIIKENIFKLLTNPLFFNTNEKGFNWQERRKILFEISGEISDEMVIASDKELAELPAILDGKTTDNYKKIINERIKNTKSSMDGIPDRIDEQKRTIPEEVVDYTAIESTVAGHRTSLEGIESELATNANGATLYRQQQQQAYKLQGDMDARKRELDTESMAGVKKLISEKTLLESDKYRISSELLVLTNKITLKTEEAKVIDTKIIELRESWRKEGASEFIKLDPNSFDCTTCGQALPADNVAEKMAELEAKFNNNKTQLLLTIQKDGKEKAGRNAAIVTEIAESTTAIKSQNAKIKLADERLVLLEKEIEVGQQQSITDYDSDPKYSILQGQLHSLQVELDKPVEDTTSEILARKREVTELIEGLNRTLNQKEIVEKAKVRIKELMAEEVKLAATLSTSEHHDFLIKKFTNVKVKMLEDSINDRFKTVRFKMFDILQDGTEKEMCKTLVNTNGAWVEFDGGNSGGKINAGLDIIGMLSEHYGVTCPIFVDNSESVSGFIDVNSQIIKLIVRKEDETLRVEVK